MRHYSNYSNYSETKKQSNMTPGRIIKLVGTGLLVLFVVIFAMNCCTVVDSGEVGIKFHKWSVNEDSYGGVEGTCKGWVFYNPFSTSIFTYPTYVQRKNYDKVKVTARDATIFEMDPTIAFKIDPNKACNIFTKYRVGIDELENGYIATCIYEAYRTCANRFTSDSLMSHRAEFEAAVYQRLQTTLANEGFIVTEFTSKIDPPESLQKTINEKNQAIQAALKAENQVKEAEANAKIAIAKAKGEGDAMRIKADAEAYYNMKISASLSPLIVQEDWIEKWNGKLPETALGTGNTTMMIGGK